MQNDAVYEELADALGKLPTPSALIYTIPGKPTPIICKASLAAAMLMKKCRFYSLLRQGFRLRPKWIYQGTTPDKPEGRQGKR